MHHQVSWNDVRHPIWNLARDVLAIVSLVVILGIFANHFDKSEWKSIVGFATTYLTLTNGHRFAKRKTTQKEEESHAEMNTVL